MSGVASRPGSFSVVSGTTLRFVSLVAAILGTSAYAYTLVYLRLPGKAEAAQVVYARCGELLRRGGAALSLDPAAIAAADRDRLAAGQCIAPFEQAQTGWVLAGMAGLLALAFGLFLAAPWWTRRRAGLVPITAAGFPQLHAALHELAEQIGLRRLPEFVLDPNTAAPGGLAFGRTGRRYLVRINAGLVPARVTDPELFRAVVLHELAHLRNRDVDLTYAAMALWRAFVAVALLPMVIVIAYPTILSAPATAPWRIPTYTLDTANHGLRALLLVLIVYLSRNAVLRTREIHADARAARHGAAEGLRRALLAAIGRPRSRRQRWFGVHPTAGARLHAVDNPLATLRPGFGELFGAGVTTMLAAGSFTSLAGLGLPHEGTPVGRYVAWVLAPLVTGMLGAAAWRAEVRRAHGVRTSLLPAALGFSLGCLLGDLASMVNFVGVWGAFGTTFSAGRMPLSGSVDVGGLSLTAGLVGASVLTAGIAIQAAVSAAGARAWLPTLRGPGTRWAWAAGVAAAAVPFAIWFGIWLELRSVPYLTGRVYHLTAADFALLGEQLWNGPGFSLWTTTYPPLQIFTGRALAIPAIALAWIYPLAVLLRRRRRPAIDDATTPSATPGAAELRSALLTALVAAAAFATALLATRAVLHHVAYDKVGFAAYYNYSVIAVVIAVQGILGGVVAARHRHGLLLGQPAALLFAVTAIVIERAVARLGTCVPGFRLYSYVPCAATVDLGFVDFLVKSIVVKGALAALVVGLLVRLVEATSELLPARFAPRRPWARPAALAGTVAALLVAALTAVTALSATDPTQAAGPSPAATPNAASTGRRLTQAEVEQVARPTAGALPDGWREDPVATTTGEYVLDDPERCAALSDDSYVTALDPARRATTTVHLSDGDKITSSALYIHVSSYAQPVPDSLFTAADTAHASCPRFSITSADGDTTFRYVVGAQPPLRLGDRAWRVDLSSTSTYGSITFTGTLAIVLIRVGHTLVQITFNALNEPVDEEILLAAMTRLTAAVP